MTNDTRAAFEAELLRLLDEYSWAFDGMDRLIGKAEHERYDKDLKQAKDALLSHVHVGRLASSRAALEDAIQYLMALNARADGSHNYYHFAANGLRALADEGVKPCS